MKKQPQIDMSMRRTLVDWLVQVKEHYKMDSKCIHLAVSYIDLFLSKMSVVRRHMNTFLPFDFVN